MSDERERSWWNLEQSVRADVRDNAVELMDEAYPEDRLSEMVGGWCPIYTAEILHLAADNIILAVTKPDTGPAFDGTPTPVNIIVANMHDALLAVAHDEWETVEDEAWYCREAEAWMFGGDECGHDDCDGSE